MMYSQGETLLLIETAAGKRPLTDLEKCLLLILRTKNHIFSKDVLKLAKKFKICATCSDRSGVISTGEKLVRKKLVTRRLKGNEYLWGLTKKGLIYSKEI